MAIDGSSSAAADAPDHAAAWANAQADQAIEALLHQTEQQIAAGHTIAPKDDNALATWRLVLERISPATPEGLRALANFIAEVRDRAADDEAAGRMVVASDLSIFADQAAELLANGGASSKAKLASEPPVRAVEATPAVAAAPVQPSTVSTDSAAGSAMPTATSEINLRPAMPEAVVAAAPSAQADADAPVQGDRLTAAEAPAPVSVAPPSVAAAMPSVPAAPPPVAVAPPPVAGAPTSVAVEPPSVAVAPPSVAAAPPSVADQATAASFASRGDAMMAIKDVSAARKYYAYAANAGSAAAAVALARTYDPAFMTRLGIIGLRPDPDAAALWYRKAAALGDSDAQARIALMNRQATR